MFFKINGNGCFQVLVNAWHLFMILMSSCRCETVNRDIRIKNTQVIESWYTGMLGGVYISCSIFLFMSHSTCKYYICWTLDYSIIRWLFACGGLSPYQYMLLNKLTSTLYLLLSRFIRDLTTRSRLMTR